MRLFRAQVGRFGLGLLGASGALATPVAAQRVVPADSLRFRPGAQLRVRMPEQVIHGRFERWAGDTLVLEVDPGRIPVPWDSVLVVAERRREPGRAIVLGALSGGVGFVVVRMLGAGLCGLGGCPSFTTQLGRGLAYGAAIGLITNTAFPSYRTRYDRRRSPW